MKTDRAIDINRMGHAPGELLQQDEGRVLADPAAAFVPAQHDAGNRSLSDPVDLVRIGDFDDEAATRRDELGDPSSGQVLVGGRQDQPVIAFAKQRELLREDDGVNVGSAQADLPALARQNPASLCCIFRGSAGEIQNTGPAGSGGGDRHSRIAKHR